VHDSIGQEDHATMGYAERLMSTGERIVHREKQHWFVFIWGARYTILALIIAGLGAVNRTDAVALLSQKPCSDLTDGEADAGHAPRWTSPDAVSGDFTFRSVRFAHLP